MRGAQGARQHEVVGDDIGHSATDSVQAARTPSHTPKSLWPPLPVLTQVRLACAANPSAEGWARRLDPGSCRPRFRRNRCCCPGRPRRPPRRPRASAAIAAAVPRRRSGGWIAPPAACTPGACHAGAGEVGRVMACGCARGRSRSLVPCTRAAGMCYTEPVPPPRWPHLNTVPYCQPSGSVPGVTTTSQAWGCSVGGLVTAMPSPVPSVHSARSRAATGPFQMMPKKRSF